MATIWNEYQKDVFNFVANGNGSAVVSAVAGSGKTTTIVECAKRIPSWKSVLFLAFNKSIATELSQRLAPFRNVTCATIHSIGMRAVAKGCGRVSVFDGKYYKYIRDNIIALSSVIDETVEDNIKKPYIRNVKNIFNLCRVNLINGADKEGIDNVIKHYGLECDLIADEVNAVATLLQSAYKMFPNDKSIDFTDMLTLACTQYKRFLPKFDFIFIDECQDLSKAQREVMLGCLKEGGRFIAVGDRKQAINGFAGAVNNSFDLLKECANGNEFPLSVNYRCGREIIKRAKEIVPQIESFEGQFDGEVIETDNFNSLQRGDMVLCRKSAPLITLCLKMLSKGIVANIKGKDMGEDLLNIIEKLSPKNVFYLYQKLDNELDRIKEEQRKKGIKDIENCQAVIRYKDRIECLKAFAEQSNGIADMKRKIEYVFSDTQQKNAVMLSTVHKSKGLEADNVFIIYPNKLPLTWENQLEWQYEQEMNLKYVAITRAKKRLVLITLSESALNKYQFEKQDFKA